jgi:putative intracellular protease/amidase
MQTSLTIVIPVYNGVTHLDFTAPHQFLVRVPNTRVLVASMGGIPVEADGLHFCDLEMLEAIDACDVLCVPGGAGILALLEDEAFLEQIYRLGKTAKYVSSVCTGSLILAAAGLITGRHAACHWAWRDLLPAFGVIPDEARVVRDGNVLTGGGVTAGIDFALTLVAELAGEDAAQDVQLRLEYAPAPPFQAGRPETAPPHILRAVSARYAASARERHERVRLVAEKRVRPHRPRRPHLLGGEISVLYDPPSESGNDPQALIAQPAKTQQKEAATLVQ